MPAGRSPQAARWQGGWFVVPWQVIFRDIDAFGHVNNAVYLTYFEWARAQLWFTLTGGSGPRDIGFIVARTECDFHHQIGLEPIDICVRIGDMRTSSFETLYEIRKGEGRQVAATGRVVVVLFDWDRQSKIPIGDEFRAKVRLLQEQTE
jgi:acyl-CoA thioester hydrolase